MDNLDKIEHDREIVLHCVSGDRSSLAVSLLQRVGYTNIFNLPGGFEEWTNKKYQVTSQKAALKEVV